MGTWVVTQTNITLSYTPINGDQITLAFAALEVASCVA